MGWEAPRHWATDHWYLKNREPFSTEPPKEIARRAYLAACEARGRHLQQMEAWEKTTEEEERRIRVEWLAVHERVKELEDAAAAVLRDPTTQARQHLADVLMSDRRDHEKGEAAAFSANRSSEPQNHTLNWDRVCGVRPHPRLGHIWRWTSKRPGATAAGSWSGSLRPR